MSCDPTDGGHRSSKLSMGSNCNGQEVWERGKDRLTNARKEGRERYGTRLRESSHLVGIDKGLYMFGSVQHHLKRIMGCPVLML